MNLYFKLQGKEVVPATREEFAESYENPDKRIIKQTKIGKALVSTVFLGLDHSFGCGYGIFFETMIFEGPSEYQVRHRTYDDAEKGHDEACAELKKELNL